MGSSSPNEEKWGRVGRALNRVNAVCKDFVMPKLNYYYNNTLTKITDTADAFPGCLSDSQGQPLRYIPDNQLTPPDGDCHQLNFLALPHYEATVQQSSRRSKHEAQCQFFQDQHKQQCKNCCCCQTCKLLNAKHQPILIKDEHELAHLYLPTYMNKEPCGISLLDPGAIFTILAKARCFSDAIMKQAVKVKVERNKWAHTNLSEWTETRMDMAFLELEDLAKLLPKKLKTSLMKELTDIKQSKTSEQQLTTLRKDHALLKRKHQILEDSKGTKKGLSMLSEKFSRVQISRRDDASDALLKSKMDEWKEQFEWAISTGIKKSDILMFGDVVAKALNLDDEQTAKLKTSFEKMTMASTTQANIEEIELVKAEKNSESFLSIYGFLGAVTDDKDKVTVAYAFHKLKFKTKANQQLTPAQKKDVEGSYSKYHALNRLDEEGIIN